MIKEKKGTELTTTRNGVSWSFLLVLIIPSIAIGLGLANLDRLPAKATTFLTSFPQLTSFRQTTPIQLEAYEQWLTSRPRDIPSLLQLVRLNFLRALTTTAPTVQLSSTNVHILKALKYLNEIDQIAPSSSAMWLVHGHFHLCTASYSAALKAYEKLENPAHKSLYKGYVAEFQGDVEQATALFKQAVTLSKGTLHETYYSLEYPVRHPLFSSSFYAKPLTKMLVFRDLIEEYYEHRNNDQATEFTSSRISSSSVGFNIRGGSVNHSNVAHFFHQNGFVVLRQLLFPYEVELIHMTHKLAMQQKLIAGFDANLARTSTYNDRFGHWYTQRMTNTIRKLTHLPVKSTYSFLCWHRHGEEGEVPKLIPHLDRMDNEYTVSCQLHYDGSGHWPIWVHKTKQQNTAASWKERPASEESLAIKMEDGDAVLFQGRKYIHWRDEMKEDGISYSSILFHYVDSHFDWAHFKNVLQKQNPAL